MPRFLFALPILLIVLAGCEEPGAPLGAPGGLPPTPTATAPTQSSEGGSGQSGQKATLVVIASHGLALPDGSQVAFRAERRLGSSREDVSSQVAWSRTGVAEALVMNASLPVAVAAPQPGTASVNVVATLGELTASVAVQVERRSVDEVTSSVAARPSLLNFAALPSKGTATRLLQISNLRKSDATGLTLELEAGSWLTRTGGNCQTTLGAESSCDLTFEVNVPERASGEHNELVKIRWDKGVTAVPVWIFVAQDECRGNEEPVPGAEFKSVALDPGCRDDGLEGTLVDLWAAKHPNDPAKPVTGNLASLFEVYNLDHQGERLPFGLAYESDNDYHVFFRALPAAIQSCPLRNYWVVDGKNVCAFRSQTGAEEESAPLGYVAPLRE